LDITNTQIHSYEIENLINLQHLYCNNCKHIKFDAFKKLININVLYCMNTNINGKSIKNLIKLNTLNCSGCMYIKNYAFENLFNLEIVWCKDCNFTKDVFKNLNIKQLSYNSNGYDGYYGYD
jgi:hypothetical protein